MQVDTTTAAEGRDQFLNLLVTQLRNQDPLEPVKQEDFLAQLAQFSTLEGVEKINENLEGNLTFQQEFQQSQNNFLIELQRTQNLTSASALVGREVTYDPDPPRGADEAIVALPRQPIVGNVESVVVQDNQILLRIDDAFVRMDQIKEITASAEHAASSQVTVSTESSDVAAARGRDQRRAF